MLGKWDTRTKRQAKYVSGEVVVSWAFFIRGAVRVDGKGALGYLVISQWPVVEG